MNQSKFLHESLRYKNMCKDSQIKINYVKNENGVSSIYAINISSLAAECLYLSLLKYMIILYKITLFHLTLKLIKLNDIKWKKFNFRFNFKEKKSILKIILQY